MSWEELEQLVSRVLSGKHYFGKQVVVAIDGKILRGTLDENRKAFICWPPICLAKGLSSWK